MAALEIRITSRGLKLNDASQLLAGPARQKLILKLAEIAYASALFGAPWKTGFLAGSIVKEVSVNEAQVTAQASYAPYVEKGTAPHEIRPVRAYALAFQSGNELVFAKLVHHPGTKPNPFMQRAAEDTLTHLPEVFREVWEDLIGE